MSPEPYPAIYPAKMAERRKYGKSKHESCRFFDGYISYMRLSHPWRDFSSADISKGELPVQSNA
jgi:hypothetical protein